MLVNETTRHLIDQIDCDSPVPGGGSISALVSALGICLARMYGHLSINKKRFKELDVSLQENFKTNFEQLLNEKEKMIQAMDHDCEAYNQVMRAYHLPKQNAEDIQKRHQAILEATKVAIASPYAIMSQSLKALTLCQQIVEHGNVNAISDLACGVIFLDAAIQGAGLNVKINLAILSEEEQQEWTNKMEALLTESHQIKETVVEKIQKMLEKY